MKFGNLEIVSGLFDACVMLKNILASLGKLSLEDLFHLQEKLDPLIRQKQNHLENELGKRGHKRAQVKITGTAEIEREAEFFYQTHKVTIQEMSVNGLMFTLPVTVIQDDILTISFRNPSSGEKKNIYCQAVRIREIQTPSGVRFEVAARAVDRNTVIAYREMLKNRGK